jgi:hypothetical protein
MDFKIFTLKITRKRTGTKTRKRRTLRRLVKSDSYVSDLRQREVPSAVRGSSISFTEKCNRGNSSDSVDTRVLFSSLLGSQENWGNETCDRSLYSEQLPFCSPFQNGDQQVYQSLYSSRYVDHQIGPFGCLFPYPNFFGFQEIS